MKILTELELQKLTTKRLLALYKKVRELTRRRDVLCVNCEEYDKDTIALMFYKDDIKKILDNREDVCL